MKWCETKHGDTKKYHTKATNLTIVVFQIIISLRKLKSYSSFPYLSHGRMCCSRIEYRFIEFSIILIQAVSPRKLYNHPLLMLVFALGGYRIRFTIQILKHKTQWSISWKWQKETIRSKTGTRYCNFDGDNIQYKNFQGHKIQSHGCKSRTKGPSRGNYGLQIWNDPFDVGFKFYPTSDSCYNRDRFSKSYQLGQWPAPFNHALERMPRMWCPLKGSLEVVST